MVTIDDLGFHLVVDAHVAAHGLLIARELLLDLLSGHQRCALLYLLFDFGAVLDITQLVLQIECLLLLQLEVLEGLVVLAHGEPARFVVARSNLLKHAHVLGVALHDGTRTAIARLVLLDEAVHLLRVVLLGLS